LEQNAMSTNSRFTEKFAESIVNVLGCFDRVIFKGHLPFGGDGYLNGWVDGVLKMRRKDFLPFVEKQSDAIVLHAQEVAQQSEAPYLFLREHCRKEALIQAEIRKRRLSEGVVAVLCCMETCRTVKLLQGEGRPRLAFARRPQRVVYFYFLDPEFGLVYVRLQSWFPFTIQVYVNGHDWLARQMAQARLGFVQEDNAFTQLDDADAAQRLADRFPQSPWIKILNQWAKRFNPLLNHSWLGKRDYYWVIDQAEFSTDVLFRSQGDLAALYPRLLDHATLQLSASDILTFLGRRLHPRFDGEVLTDCKTDRLPGARIKHRVKNNWLKMYDKFRRILRIETVINQPREFRVRRFRPRQGRRCLTWCPMNKGVANFYRYHDVARGANQRYLDALAAVERPADTGKQLERLCEPARFHQRPRRGLNPFRREELDLFFAVLAGPHRLHGLRNRDLAQALDNSPTNDPAERRRRTTRVSRLLQLLRAHALIAKIPHANRYRITPKGETLMAAAIHLRYTALHGMALTVA
jgi:hypothetical protein